MWSLLLDVFQVYALFIISLNALRSLHCAGEPELLNGSGTLDNLHCYLNCPLFIWQCDRARSLFAAFLDDHALSKEIRVVLINFQRSYCLIKLIFLIMHFLENYEWY